MNNLGLMEPQPPASSYEKLKKISDYAAIFHNFYACLRLRKSVGRGNGNVKTVHLRNGLRMNVRAGTPDISVIWEVVKGGGICLH